jgi:putative tryptophan/tyrosine transport system substrate-binding protein
MNRRDAIAAAFLLAASPRLASQGMRRVGVVQGPGGNFAREKWAGRAFLAAMKDLGYQEGRDFAYDLREWQKPEEVRNLVAELVRLKTDVIVASAPPSIVGARDVTDRIPIVMAYAADPVATGLVRSLSRPGGNMTGLTWDHGFDTVLKQLELLREALPQARSIAILWDASDTAHPIYAGYFDQAGARLRLRIISLGVRAGKDFAPAFESMRKSKAEALVVLPSAQLIIPQRHQVMELVRANRLPTITGPIHWDFPGALFLWAPSQEHVPQRAAVFVHRILKGANPGDLPIEQPSRYLFHVDLGVARTLSIAVPNSVLVRADKVIQ